MAGRAGDAQEVRSQRLLTLCAGPSAAARPAPYLDLAAPRRRARFDPRPREGDGAAVNECLVRPRRTTADVMCCREYHRARAFGNPVTGRSQRTSIRASPPCLPASVYRLPARYHPPACLYSDRAPLSPPRGRGHVRRLPPRAQPLPGTRAGPQQGEERGQAFRPRDSVATGIPAP
jgi:hypothetical protein